MQRTGECALNFPDAVFWKKVERIARATGRKRVPSYKNAMGYEYVSNKFVLGSFTSIASETIVPPRVAECSLQFEAKLVHMRRSESSTIGVVREFLVVEVCVTRVHAHRHIVIDGTNHVDTARWSPLLYVFRHYFGTGPERGKTFRAEG